MAALLLPPFPFFFLLQDLRYLQEDLTRQRAQFSASLKDREAEVSELKGQLLASAAASEPAPHGRRDGPSFRRHYCIARDIRRPLGQGEGMLYTLGWGRYSIY